jgi:perosamine synthetase
MRLISYGRHLIDDADINAVLDVLKGISLTQGDRVPAFEDAIARRVGARYAVAVCNGTAALHLACLAAGVGEGGTAVTSPNTFVASANCARFSGASIELADIQAESLNLDPEQLDAVCHRRQNVQAVIPVHFAGLPCDMERIRKVARSCDAAVIEDASHALGATYADGSAVGNCRYSDMTTFSFHPVKMITTGEGGMITTNDEMLFRKLLRLRSHGINKLDDPLLSPVNAYDEGEVNAWYYEMQELGFNYRLTDMQAALGLSQLNKLDGFIDRRRVLARRYDAHWREHALLRPTQMGTRHQSSLHLYPVRIDFEQLGMTRHRFMRALAEKGIITQTHYIPVHFHPYYERLGVSSEALTIAERYYREALSLPLYYSLSDEEQSYVIDTIDGLLG